MSREKTGDKKTKEKRVRPSSPKKRDPFQTKKIRRFVGSAEVLGFKAAHCGCAAQLASKTSPDDVPPAVAPAMPATPATPATAPRAGAAAPRSS